MIPATTNYQNALSTFLSGKIQILITIAGYSRSFTNYDSGIGGQYKWIESVDDLVTNINDLDGGSDQLSLSFTVQDNNRLITGDFPSFTFEGKLVTVKVGFASLAQTDFMTVFTGYISTVASANNNLSYYFTCTDQTAKLSNVVYLTGDNGGPTSSTNIKTLNGNPLDIMLDILQNQIGLSSAYIDTTKINNYKNGPFSGFKFVFHLSQSVAALDFIKAQLLKPLGGYLWVNSAGQITVNFFYPLTSPPTAQQTLGPRTWLSIPTAEQTDIINAVQYQFDKDDSNSNSSNNYFSQDTETYGPSTSLYGLVGEQNLQADGMRSSNQGFFIAKLISRFIFYRYGLKNPKFDQNAAEAIWQCLRLEPGDIVAVTHSQIPDRKAGVMGITNKLFEILNRTINFNEGKVTLTMIDASYLSTFGNYLIAPTGEFPYAPLPPPAAPTLSQAAGGSLAAATEYYKVTYVTAGGETQASAETSIARLANNVVTVTSPPQAKHATGYNVYAWTVTGGELKQNSTPIAIGTNWTEPVGGLSGSGAAPPSSDTSGVASSTDKNKYMFMCSDTDKYTNNDPAHVLG